MRHGGIAAAVLMACAGLSPARAGTFSVSPIRLDLAPGQASTAVTVSNQGDDSKLVQVSVLRWTRDGGQDHTSPDDSLIVTPPLFQLAPGGGSQVVRIGFPQPPPAAPVEQAWRVIAEEVQSQAPVGAAASGSSINLLLRISLPLFLAPATPHQSLHWEGSVDAAGKLHLVASNSGNVSERLDELVVNAADGKTRLGRQPGPIYIFPGERRVLDLAPAARLKAGPVKLMLQGTPQALTTDLVLRAQ